jgi:hypothetical protein
VLLVGAHISGQLDMSGGTLTNENGPALNADALTVEQHMLCGEGFAARGEVRLVSAHIGGLLDFSRGTLTNQEGRALNVERAVVTGALVLRPITMCGTVHLTHAQVGKYLDDSATWPDTLRLDAFTYGSIGAYPEVTVDDRLRWLSRNASGYSAQPYEQLGAVYRQSGRENEARRVAIEKQRQSRAQLNVLGKGWNIVLGWTVGYGYRTSQAGLWLLGLLIAGSIVFQAAHDQHQLTAAHSQPEEQPPFQPVIYTLDVILPVVNLHQRDAWIAHGLVQWVALACTLGGWVLTTAVVLSLTGILKRN